MTDEADPPAREGVDCVDDAPDRDDVDSATDADHWVYVLRCADDTLYTGYATDVERRVAEHDAGEGAKYTRGRTPVELVYAEPCESRSDALSREYEIKSLRRRQKERLIE